MSRIALIVSAAAGLGAVLVLFALGAPAHAGALAGLSGAGASAALGLLWIVVFVLVVLCVPPLVLTAAVDAWMDRRAAARTPQGSGLGSRSGPGDT